MTAIASSSCSQKYSIPESFIGAISENTPIKYTGDSNVTNISQLSFMLTFFNKNKDIIWSNNINKVILEKLTLCENDTILQTADVENFEWVNNVLCLKSGLEFNTNDWNDTGTNLLNSNKQYHFEIFIKVSGFHLHFDNVLFTTPNILSARTLYNVHDTLAQGDDQFIPFPYIDRENPNNYGDVQWYVGAIGFHGKLPTFIAHAHDYSAGTWTNPNGNDMGEHNVVDGQFTAYIDAHTSDGLNYNFYSAACSYDN
ncbi:MAG: hypothetical protein LBM72_00960, partial [Mycoplasmataceae bacterium]|nr:hypothetical protein [Mycoplasmataceae bacterium]